MTDSQKSTGRFDDLGISDKFLGILAKNKFEIPTPIQHQVIPGAIKGKDVIGIAQTGTGKTLAFGIPMIEQLIQTRGQGLILVPTRELALQVEKSLRAVGTGMGFRFATLIGGVPQYAQVRSLQNNPHIVIATPGRLDDLMKQRAYTLDRVNVIALDEADRMLDIGFLPQIKRILQIAPKKRQTLLFSATMPKSISELASKFMKLPLRIEIAPQGTSAENVEQEVFVITKKDKMRLLDSLLQQYKNEKVLIFSRTKHGAKKIARDVRNFKHTATEIHSNRSQNQRQAALEGFTRGKYRVMVATDIAARGIDVKDIAIVINYDLPENSEDYVHRIGRTGRAGAFGKAISFVTPSEKASIRKIEFLIRQTLPVLALPQLPESRKPMPSDEKDDSWRASRDGGRGRGGFSSGRSSRGGGSGFGGRSSGGSRSGGSGRPSRGGSGRSSGGSRDERFNSRSTDDRRERTSGLERPSRGGGSSESSSRDDRSSASGRNSRPSRGRSGRSGSGGSSSRRPSRGGGSGFGGRSSGGSRSGGSGRPSRGGQSRRSR